MPSTTSLPALPCVPLTERRPVASGQDWLKDAGSVPAALLDGNGNSGAGALALAFAVATGDLPGASGPLLEMVGDG